MCKHKDFQISATTMNEEVQEIATEGIIGIIPVLAQSIQNKFSQFVDFILDDDLLAILDIDEMISANCAPEVEKYVLKIEEKCTQTSNLMDKEGQKIENLKKLKFELMNQIAGKSDKHNKLKKKNSSLLKKCKSLQDSRDKVLAFKLMTATDFNYSGPNISGYSTCPQTKAIKTFIYDPNKMSQTEITNSLYAHIKEVFNCN